jgi:CubicO group peptidase (beta-lactamase class C family)
VSVVLGAAMQAGLKVSPSTPVYETMMPGPLPADLDPRRRAMRLQHLLSMTSGFFCDDSNPEAPGSEDKMGDSDEPDYYKFILNVPMASAPGLEKGVYCSAVSNLALGVVGGAVGESPLYLFERLVAEPLKITRYAWGTDPSGQPFGGGSMQFLPRDYAKFGQLLLNGGTWNGRRILSPAFISEITRVHSRLGRRDRGYGYQWWVEEYPFQGRTIQSYASLGTGGNIVVVFPELDLVVAINGGSYGSAGWRYNQVEFIPKYVLPAVRPGSVRQGSVRPGEQNR